MARPQTYNRQDVLEATMQLFWRKGYEATSIKELVEATGLQPGSLYSAFENKRQLFSESLELYFEQLYSEVKLALEADTSAEMRIRNLFDKVLLGYLMSSGRKSCLLLNTLLEIPDEDREMRSRISSMYKKIEEDLCFVLGEARIQGSLRPGISPEIMAKTLMSNIFGMEVYSHMSQDENELKQIMNNMMCIFEIS